MTADAGAESAEPSLVVLMGERHRMVNLAYRLLGSLSDAEDAVQEAYARWYAMPRAERDAVGSPGGWLTTVTSRICLNLLNSARVRRETYVGQWIPEPLPEHAGGLAVRAGGSHTDPADRITLDESVSMAFLVVLESMTPAERVAFVLHDVFRYSFAEVAEVVGRSPGACRQLASAARRRVRPPGAGAMPPDRKAGLVREFKQVWAAKDIDALIGLLDPDATVTTDGGGLAPAVAHPVTGGREIATACADLAARGPLTILERAVNGEPGLISRRDGATVAVLAFDVDRGRITRIWAVLNPEKLRLWNTG
ncbi:RNA polymerase sigma factor SigJ [Streptomyces aculeolatus]